VRILQLRQDAASLETIVEKLEGECRTCHVQDGEQAEAIERCDNTAISSSALVAKDGMIVYDEYTIKQL
jgi:hypothetical protein